MCGFRTFWQSTIFSICKNICCECVCLCVSVFVLGCVVITPANTLHTAHGQTEWILKFNQPHLREYGLNKKITTNPPKMQKQLKLNQKCRIVELQLACVCMCVWLHWFMQPTTELRPFVALSNRNTLQHTHTHTHIHIYIYRDSRCLAV